VASTRHERGFDPRVDLGDSRLRISTEMTTTYNHDEVASPEMTGRGTITFTGAGPGRTSRHGTVLRSATRRSVPARIVWTGEPQIDHDPFVKVSPRRPELTGRRIGIAGRCSVRRVETHPRARSASPRLRSPTRKARLRRTPDRPRGGPRARGRCCMDAAGERRPSSTKSS
jgi:hypothetical protein